MDLKPSVAQELLQGLPDPIFRRIALNPTFRESTGLDLRVDRYGLPRGELLTAIQGAVRGQEIPVMDRSGATSRILLEDNRIVILRQVADGAETRLIQGDLQFLSPDPAIRREAFLQSLAQFGATGPKPDDWLLLLEDRQVTAVELDRLYDEMRASLNQWRAWITEKIDTQRALISDLTPDSLDYFSSLCGPPPCDTAPEEWIAGPLVEHRRRLVRTDLVSGLAAILPGSIRHDLGPAALVAHLDDNTVWTAVQALPNFIDPFSLLGLLDITLPRREHHTGFSDMAEMLVQALLADPFRRPDGMDLSNFYPGLVRTCQQSLRRTDSLASQPVEWQRLCAFTHAGHLLEIFGRLNFDVDAMTDGLPSGNTSFDLLGELLNCRSAPMWTAENLTGASIRSEVLARLSCLRDQEIANGRTFPHDNHVKVAIEQAGPAINLAGPLEGHLRPYTLATDWTFPDEVRQQALDGLISDPRNECRHLLALAGFFPLDESIITAMVDVAASMRLDSDDPTEALAPLMHLALIATRQSDPTLADAVASRCIREARNLTSESKGLERCDRLFRALLTASTAQPDWSTWAASKLVAFTMTMPAGPWHEHVNALLTQMKQLLRPAEWRFGRATAYAKLSNLPTDQSP